eukprot:COSAG06_NODE_2979_length_5993_cov_127.879539_5_plen_179_part_00
MWTRPRSQRQHLRRRRRQQQQHQQQRRQHHLQPQSRLQRSTQRRWMWLTSQHCKGYLQRASKPVWGRTKTRKAGAGERYVSCCVVLCCRHDLANCKVLVDFDTNSLATAFLLPLLFSVYSPENRPGRVKRLSPALNVPRTTPCHPQARPLPTPARASACSKMRRSILLISILDGVGEN